MGKHHHCFAQAPAVTSIQLLQAIGKPIVVFYHPKLWSNRIFLQKFILNTTDFLESSVKQILCLKEAVLASAMCFKT